jgi:hypothetical protein
MDNWQDEIIYPSFLRDLIEGRINLGLLAAKIDESLNF